MGPQSLLVYNVAQYKLRQSLLTKDETTPNQLGKEVQNPTMRWIFQLMEGLGIIRFNKIFDVFAFIVTSIITFIRQNLAKVEK